jgi:hypothetical protein
MKEIPLTQGQVALIDDEDFELVSQYKWYAQWSPLSRSFYAVTNIRKPNGKYTHLQMHRLIMNARKGEQVDHIHHLTLDNRKSELRLCTPSQNTQNQGVRPDNTSGFKGVSWHKPSQKWLVHVGVNGKVKHVGYFDTPELANEARCAAALKYHGEFANIS